MMHCRASSIAVELLAGLQIMVVLVCSRVPLRSKAMVKAGLCITVLVKRGSWAPELVHDRACTSQFTPY